jgi:hypothetical protein
MRFIRNAVIKADDLLGYGRPKAEHKWWLDPEDVDGTLREVGGGQGKPS